MRAVLVNNEGDFDPDQDRNRLGREQDDFTARAVALDPTGTSAWGFRATALAYLARWDAAKAAAAKADLLRAVPGYTIAQLRAKRYSDHPDYLVLAEKHWYSGLRKAGIPEQ